MKKIERGVPHMLAFRRRCLRYSKVYCDVRKSLLLAWNQNRHIMYYKFYIPYTNSKISIGLLYILPHFIWWHRLNHCTSLVRNLVALILVRSLVKLLIFHTSTILALLWFTNFKRRRFQNLSISTLANNIKNS